MKHYIIVKFNNKVEKDKLVQPIQELFNQTLSISGIHSVDVYLSNSDRPNRYDLMIKMNMDKEALKIYDESEAHKTWKRKYGESIVSKTIFDCE